MMKSRKFIGRKKELGKLDEIYRGEGTRLVVITGRRRVGKTRLVTEFAEDKDHIRIQFEKRQVKYNLAKLNGVIGKKAGIPTPNFSDLVDSFEYIRSMGVKLVILDEFSYLIRYSDALAQFQTILDEVLSDSSIMLVVLGSSFSIMKRGMIEYGSPLYGRSEGMINLQPLDLGEIGEWFGHLDARDLVTLYACTGGVPRYLELVPEKGDIRENIEELFFDPNSFLFREAKELLEEEFDDPSTYYAILEAISRGATRVSRIGDLAYVEPKNTAKYLRVLRDLGMIRKEVPFRSGKKRGIYRFKDPYFAFWFRFVSDSFEEIESGFDPGVKERFKRDLDIFMGTQFEFMVGGLLPKLLPFKVLSLGRWWKRGVEVDWILLGEKDICFVEVKWGEKAGRDIERLVNGLEEKSRSFGEKRRRAHYCIVAGKLKGGKGGHPENVHLIDLKDIRRIM